MSRYKAWTTKDGRKIPINKMSESHLLNTIKYIELFADINHINRVSDGYSFIGSLQGEMAIDAAENAVNSLEDTDPIELLPSKLQAIYNDMYSLARKRCLL